MKPVEEFVVPWVRASDSYSDKHLEFAWQHPDVTRLMSNENPLPPAEAVVDAVVETVRRGNLYPDSGPKLRAKLAAADGLEAGNVLLGNGSTEVLDIIIRTFVAAGDEVVIPVPTFSMYETRVRVNGGQPVLVPMTHDFRWPVDALIEAVNERTKLIFICTPNNPTGNEIDAADLRRLLALGIPTVVDEAYYELGSAPHTRAGWIQEFPNLLINRTFSKAFGLAGLRIGYALADAGVIAYLQRVKIPWNVGLLPLAAALAALEDADGLRERQALNQQGRDYLCAEIARIPGLRAFPSQGNFVLIDASRLGRPSQTIVSDLIERGVYVRPMSPHHMGEGFVRVTVGTPAQNAHFVSVLRAYVASATAG